MAIQIHSNKTGGATVILNGLAKNPVWETDNPAIITIVPGPGGIADHFTALLVPVSSHSSGGAIISCTTTKLDDSGTIPAAEHIEVVEAAATQVTSFIIVENP